MRAVYMLDFLFICHLGLSRFLAMLDTGSLCMPFKPLSFVA